MKLHSFLTCIASLALCDPVAGASSWAFDTGLLVDNGSCSQRYLAVLEPALARATTIAKNTNTWLSVNPSPNFARALLRWDSKYARSVFGGGEIQMYGYDETIPGIADFTGRMSWSDPGRWGSAMRPAKNLVNTPVGLAERSQHDHRSHNYSHHLLPLTYIKGYILQRRKCRPKIRKWSLCHVQ